MTTIYDLYFPEIEPICFKKELKFLEEQLDELFLLFKTKMTEPKKNKPLHYANALQSIFSMQHARKAQSQGVRVEPQLGSQQGQATQPVGLGSIGQSIGGCF